MIHISHGIYTSVLGKKAIPFEHYAQEPLPDHSPLFFQNIPPKLEKNFPSDQKAWRTQNPDDCLGAILNQKDHTRVISKNIGLSLYF